MKRGFKGDRGSAGKHRWEPCSRGILNQAASAQLRRRRFLKLIAGGTIVAAASAGGGVGFGVYLNSNSSARSTNNGDCLPVGGIACATVVDLIPNYIEGDLEKLISEQITAHLMKCVSCRRKYTMLCRSIEEQSESRPKNPKI